MEVALEILLWRYGFKGSCGGVHFNGSSGGGGSV